MDDFKRKCFFCSKNIEGKKTMEHVIPNSLLGRLGIKETTLTGERVTQYSRIKVPSHAACNNEFGSEYEDKVFELLENTDLLYETLMEEEKSFSIMYHASESATAILTTWLSKIYYGLFYDDYIKTKDEAWRDTCAFIIQNDNFKFVQDSYAKGFGFQLPSSLYVFKTNNSETDLITMVNPSTILFKIGTITLILCICDGYLTKNYLLNNTLSSLRALMAEEEGKNSKFPVHKLALGELIALRLCIPKTPKFVYSENQIINMSLTTMASNPENMYQINIDELAQVRESILSEFNISINV
ncbi:hypothetical protein [Aliivibrio sp. SR45-2]|uniref:hypothetical protein n=1 Tax=Aliivibrio sp. SR45-2 TaxID=2760931 RepID=UPI0015FC18C2|nr:hypothetical protein [Aliivibrio sp. SR45-2]MBB1315993.1 hypothetical protein [Aliivibrio sp. SR45-2]